MPLDAYHQRASECLKLAQTAPRAQDQVTWSELALYWLRLSEFADRYRYDADPSDHARAA
jgi:hypothetical protein